MKTLIIDNYDSFTYNLVHLVADVRGTAPIVVTNNARWEDIPWHEIECVIVSPGPGNPEREDDFGISADVIARCDLPLFGVCLGHQGIGALAGASVVPAPTPMHGRISSVFHDGTGLFAGIPDPFSVVRYHSLAVADVPPELRVTATTEDDVVMAMEHVSRPQWGVQFHPESIKTDHGRDVLANFYRLVDAWHARRTVEPRGSARPVLQTRRLSVRLQPETIFANLFADAEHGFWLDSGGDPGPRSRFSILGDANGPLAEVVTYDVRRTRVTSSRLGTQRIIKTPVLEYLAERCAEMRPSRADVIGPESAFELGFVGYLGYEVKADTGGELRFDSPTPDAAFVFADRAVLHDREDGSVWLLALSVSDGTPGADESAALSWFDTTEQRLSGVRPTAAETSAPETGADGPVSMRHSREAYLARISAVMQLIRAGETYELCLTNQGRATVSLDPYALYRRMRLANPAPFGAFLRFGPLSVLSASPERFLSVDTSGVVESRPIKGTRPRSSDSMEDDRIRSELGSSEKDRAENLMIVDLVRNDLSKVCAFGTVRVPRLFDVETFATVHQLVSTVNGRLRDGKTAFDAVRAAFPGGSMTGAPKIRTMELIDGLEEGPRGVYSGALGWFSLSGACDLSIVIRTITMHGTEATFGTGGAIIALSDPEDEWEETRVKSRVMRALLDPVDGGDVDGAGS